MLTHLSHLAVHYVYQYLDICMYNKQRIEGLLVFPSEDDITSKETTLCVLVCSGSPLSKVEQALYCIRQRSISYKFSDRKMRLKMIQEIHF